MNEQGKLIGAPISRIDGRLKVTGKATYSAEFQVSNLVYGFPVQSAIAAGEIVSIDKSAAQKSNGVLLILTHENALKLQPRPAVTPQNRGTRSTPVLQDKKIFQYGQYVAFVVAETYEQARNAARLIKVEYKIDTPKIDFEANAKNAYKPEIINAGYATDTSWGNIENGLKNSAATISEIYETPIEVHNPLEPHATIAAFDGEKLLVYESSQTVGQARDGIANTFGIPKENIRILSPFIGGGFGSKLQLREHAVLTVMAAKMLNRPVKTAITRQMMQMNVGIRQHNHQKLRLGASRDGKLGALAHETVTHTSFDEEFVGKTRQKFADHARQTFIKEKNDERKWNGFS